MMDSIAMRLQNNVDVQQLTDNLELELTTTERRRFPRLNDMRFYR